MVTGMETSMPESTIGKMEERILESFDEDENNYNAERNKRRFVKTGRQLQQYPGETDSESVEFRAKMNNFLRNEGKFQRNDNITTPAEGEGRSGLDSPKFTDDDYERRKHS